MAGKKGGDVTKAKVFQPKQGTVDGSPDEAAAPPPPLTPEQQGKAEKAKKYKYADYVTLTRDEFAKLCSEHTEEGAKRIIEILNNYKGSSGKKYKSDYMTILNWVVGRYNEELQKNGYQNKGTIPGGTGQAGGEGYRDTL